jgi:glycerate 2-kinase
VSLAGVLAGAFERGVAGIDLARRVREALVAVGPSPQAVRVVAVGKAAPRMLEGALSRWGDRVTRGLLILPEGVPALSYGGRVEVRRTAHPFPDARSVAAGERALAFVREGSPRDVVLALVSGGASALACAPRGDLREMIAVTRALLAAGATINEMNVVRRHADRLKGGGLTRAAAPRHVLAVIVSDVVTGAGFDVGSGPTLPDPTTLDEARDVLSRLAPAVAAQVKIAETLKPWDLAARRQRARVVASPAHLARAVASELAGAGLAPRILPPAVDDVAVLAREYAALTSSLGHGEALVRAAEPTVFVRAAAPGRGGRSSHLAAMVARTIPEGFAFLAGASDGVDGQSDQAGASVDAETRRRVTIPRLEDALARFDTATLLEEAKAAIVLGPTGNNLADVHVLARA